MRLVLWALVLLLSAAPLATAQQVDRDALVFVEIEENLGGGARRVVSTGSGAVIHPRGYVLTAKHVVEKAFADPAKFSVFGRLRSRNGIERYPMTRVGLTPDYDFALAQFPTGLKDEWSFVGFETDDLEAQEKVTGWGFPLNQDLSPLPGTVTQFDPPNLRINADFTSGMSGGPVLDQAGKVRAIIASGVTAPDPLKLNEMALVPGFTSAAPLRLARPLLLLLPEAQADTPAPPIAEAVPRVDKIGGSVSVRVAGYQGNLPPAEQSGGFGERVQVQAVGTERSDCDEDFGRTISSARSSAEVDRMGDSGVQFVFDVSAQGGHYRTSSIGSCIGNRPFGIEPHDTQTSAEAILEAQIDFIAGSKPVEFLWRNMAGARLDVLGVGAADTASGVAGPTFGVDLSGEGSHTFKLSPGNRYQAVIRHRPVAEAGGASVQRITADGQVTLR